MTTITVPRATWDALREALREVLLCVPNAQKVTLLAALTAANAASHPKPETTPATEGGAITSESAANAVSVEPEIVAIEGMPTGLGNEPEILAQWDEVKAAAEGEWGRRQWHSVGAWLYEGDAIAVISDHSRDATKMVQAQATEPAWWPIETAPKDGSEILLGHPDGSMAVGWWREDRTRGKVCGWSDGWSDGDDFALTWPSHWKPKPAAPEQKP